MLLAGNGRNPPNVCQAARGERRSHERRPAYFVVAMPPSTGMIAPVT